ncbi:hypothetical protein [Clostridium fungisolvens]|uniref:Uncharacterized protein n=1 Tax=Clostridium fungisolvens TaxID=1604897 RepID=A0A6V8SHG9_9CLOT|nr:hypothetical protein [Clostridium fungisolvens]GFP76617.1 hypothetical protein bsdtw1_02720 [Clostridium fungisolvens]
MENKKLLLISIIMLSLSIVFGSIFIGYSISKSEKTQISTSPSIESNVLNLSQVAKYLDMSEGEVQGIINTEKAALDQSKVFTGMMFPYFTVNDKQYFYKNEIDEWLKEVSKTHRQYDTKKGWVLQ